MTMTGNCGTVQWMAPEVLASEKYAEPADVYSFAIVCWELLSRACPYDGMSQIQVGGGGVAPVGKEGMLQGVTCIFTPGHGGVLFLPWVMMCLVHGIVACFWCFAGVVVKAVLFLSWIYVSVAESY